LRHGQNNSMRQKLPAWIYRLLLFLAAFFLLALLVVAVGRISYPYELEWMEGGSLQHVQQLLSGDPLYAEPSIDFIPFIYTPFYYLLVAPIAFLLGDGFFPLRLVSLLATLGTFVLVYRAIRAEGGTAAGGLIGCGFYAAMFELSGAWFDLGRVDSLMIFLLLAGCLLLKHSSRQRGATLAGLLLGLGFFTKQTVLVAVLPVIGWELITRRRQGIACLLAFTAVLVATTVACYVLTGGWYKYYVFDLPRQHGLASEFVVGFWLADLLMLVPVLLLLSGWGLLRMWREKEQSGQRYRSGFYLAMLVGWLGASWFSRLHNGGYANVLMPAYLAVSLLAGLGLSMTRQRERAWTTVVSVAACVQLAFLLYNPLAHIPSAEDQAAGDRIVERLRQLDGEVLVPYHGYLARMAGKESAAHHMAMSDVQRASDQLHWKKLQAQYEQALAERRYAAILMSVPEWFPKELAETYQQTFDFFPGRKDETFRPLEGAPHYRPRWIYQPGK
jgi:4-amino-4-deoxy-L-arabinose transferase-like glycosyltransferase